MDMDENAVKELLKPVDLLILDLKNAVEYYNADEKNPKLNAENKALLERAQAASDLLGEIVFKVAMRQRLGGE
jgi:uncharacterized membrane protein (UPF0182 family)